MTTVTQPNNQVITVRISVELLTEIKELELAWDASKSEVVRHLLREALVRYE